MRRVKFSLARVVRACRAYFAFSLPVGNNFPAFVPSLPWEHPSPIKFYQRRSSLFVGQNLCGSTVTAIFILAIYPHDSILRDTVSLSQYLEQRVSGSGHLLFYIFLRRALGEYFESVARVSIRCTFHLANIVAGNSFEKFTFFIAPWTSSATEIFAVGLRESLEE